MKDSEVLNKLIERWPDRSFSVREEEENGILKNILCIDGNPCRVAWSKMTDFDENSFLLKDVQAMMLDAIVTEVARTFGEDIKKGIQ